MDKQQINKMEQCLRDLLVEHDALLMLLKRKHQAVRDAKPAVVEDCTMRENAHVQRIGRLEKERQQLLAVITQSMEGRQGLMRISQIAECVEEPQRSNLIVLAAQLRQRMVEIKEVSQVTKAAMEGLVKHMQGVVQMIVQTVGGGGTYGRRGRVTQAAKVSSFTAVA